jgi:uncharacterized 2Fe-2S/4Fe-4S cluster protein (DUF4445 family)
MDQSVLVTITIHTHFLIGEGKRNAVQMYNNLRVKRTMENPRTQINNSIKRNMITVINSGK